MKERTIDRRDPVTAEGLHEQLTPQPLPLGAGSRPLSMSYGSLFSFPLNDRQPQAHVLSLWPEKVSRKAKRRQVEDKPEFPCF